jgi:hypothetical protein
MSDIVQFIEARLRDDEAQIQIQPWKIGLDNPTESLSDNIEGHDMHDVNHDDPNVPLINNIRHVPDQ